MIHEVFRLHKPPLFVCFHQILVLKAFIKRVINHPEVYWAQENLHYLHLTAHGGCTFQSFFCQTVPKGENHGVNSFRWFALSCNSKSTFFLSPSDTFLYIFSEKLKTDVNFSPTLRVCESANRPDCSSLLARESLSSVTQTPFKLCPDRIFRQTRELAGTRRCRRDESSAVFALLPK